MLTVEVELLTGRYAATSHHDRGRAEWPPHPARLFSALVAALHDREPPDAKEREALLWLERLAPPTLDVDLGVDGSVGRRDVCDVFVPVNDITLVGDPEKPVRDKREALALLEAREPTKETEREIKSARNDLAKVEKKLAELVRAQQEIDQEPSKKALATAAALLPDRRTRQVRTFPVVVPTRPTFAFTWNVEAPADVRAALDRLCERVTRLGHSSSLVRCVVVDRTPEPALVADATGDHVLRTVGPGQLKRLENEHERHRGVEARVLPSRPQRYGSPRPPERQIAPSSVLAGEWILFERVGGSRPLASRTAQLTQALRRAVIEANGCENLPSTISGHGADGGPSTSPHVAFIGCPFVGTEHADGSLQGFAIVMPRDLARDDRETLLRVIAHWEKTRAIPGREQGTMGLGTGEPRSVVVEVRRVETTDKRSLRPTTWCRTSRRFVTATPIALDRYPGNLRSNRDGTASRAAREAEASIADACARIGLPRPERVEISLAPLLPGAQPVRAHTPWPRGANRSPRTRVHAEIVFAEPVSGPVILGAGRYVGLGLCLPVGSAARPR